MEFNPIPPVGREADGVSPMTHMGRFASCWRRTVSVGCAIIVAWLAGAHASPVQARQNHPDFSGRWLSITSEWGPGESEFRWGLEVRQRPEAIEVNKFYVHSGGESLPDFVVYRFQGQETVEVINVDGAMARVVSTVSWLGETLVYNVRIGTDRTVRRWSLNERGQLLVESTSAGRLTSVQTYERQR